jgi:hypothetical protein
MRRYVMSAAIAAALLMVVPAIAAAAPIRFVATGNANVSGYVEFDDADFDGTNFQFLFNSEILDLSLEVFGESFTLADVVTGDQTIIDSSGAITLIYNGAGNLANNGSLAIAFFPDGYGGTASDGDASLALGAPGGGLADDEFYAVKWEAQAVPEPASLLVFGTAGVGLLLRKRSKKA